MDQLQEQLGSILANPEMMQKIAAMAQNLSQSQQTNEGNRDQPSGFPADIDLGMLQKISSIAGNSHIDSNQQNLLSALSPYLSSDRIGKLEKAMRAARIANMASTFLGSTGLLLNTGR